MTLSIRERIYAKVEELLAGITSPFGVEVHRNRDSAVDTFPALNIVDGAQTTDSSAPHFSRCLMPLDVEGYVTETENENIGTAINALYAATVFALCADVTLGGLTVDVQESEMTSEVSRSEGQGPLGHFLVRFQVEYWTLQGDPYSLAP